MSQRETAKKAKERIVHQVKEEAKETHVVSSGVKAVKKPLETPPMKKPQDTFVVSSGAKPPPVPKVQQPQVKNPQDTFVVASGAKPPHTPKEPQPQAKKPQDTFVVASGAKPPPHPKAVQETFAIPRGLDEGKATTSASAPISGRHGHELIGPYVRSGELLGKGSFGKVYLGVHKDTGILVAIKVMEKKKVGNLEEEILILKGLATLKCQNLVNFLYDMPDKEGEKFLYLVFEHCPTTLYAYLSLLESKAQCMVLEEVRLVLSGLAEGLVALNKNNIIHRDIKPDNILLTMVDLKTTVKLSDFGESRVLLDGEKAQTLCGTYEYMAPEVILLIGHDLTSDHYSVGVVGYECATGGLPFGVEQRKKMGAFWEAALPLGFMPPLPGSMDPLLKDLLRGLLQCKAKKRMTLKAFHEHAFLRAPGGPATAGAAGQSGTYTVELPSVTYLESVYKTARAHFSLPAGTFVVGPSAVETEKTEGDEEADGGQEDMGGMLNEPASEVSTKLAFCPACRKSGKRRERKFDACNTCYTWYNQWEGTSFQCVGGICCDDDPCNPCRRADRLAKCSDIFGPIKRHKPKTNG